MKRYLSIFTLAVMIFIITGCTREDITKATYHGQSFHWESTMIFDEEGKQSLNIKYLGQEQLPIGVSFNAEFLSGNGSGGCVEYGELANEVFGDSPLKMTMIKRYMEMYQNIETRIPLR